MCILESGPRLVNFEKASSFLDEDEATLELTSQVQLPYVDTPIKALISPERDWLYLLNEEGALAYYDIRSKDEPIHIEDVTVIDEGSIADYFRIFNRWYFITACR